MNIDRCEVLRYLGYKNQHIDNDLNNMISSCIEEIKAIARPEYTYRIFQVELDGEQVKLKNSQVILKGKNIYKHLENSKKCVIIAATLGVLVDNKIRYYNKVDLTRALILDACATEAIEAVCNEAEAEIRYLAKEEEMLLNFRYSPGYGDFPIDIQPKILDLLNAQTLIGLTCTKDFIMLPRKSVTAVIGFVQKESELLKKGCESCSAYSSCTYRRDGNSCGL